MNSWYALHVRSCCERIVSLQLAAVDVPNFYPHRIEKSKDKRRDVEVRFMPGYVFGQFDLEDDTAVVAIPQVVRIVGFGRYAIAIPDFEIEQAQKLAAMAEHADIAACEFLAAGVRVRVCHGPFAGLEGYVSRAKGGSTRVVVSVAAIACSAFVEVDAAAVEAIPGMQLAA